MTTIAEDRDSWKASGILRRDFRHTHDGPEVPAHRRTHSRAEKAGCRRKAGRPHLPVRVSRSSRMDVDVCRSCGKTLAWYWQGWR